MSLTDDWKDGKVQGFYWCKVNVENKENIIPAFLIKNMKTFEEKDIKSLGVIEFLTSCDYEELKHLKEQAVNTADDYAKENEKLKSEIKHLKDLQAVEDKEVERLRNLLKECKEYLSDVEEYRTKNADETYLLLTRINAAIGESEVLK